MICDFCSSPNVRWEHNCSAHKNVLGAQDDGRWAVCDPCHECVVNGDRRALAMRSSWADKTPTPDQQLRSYLVAQQRFWDHHLGYVAMSEEEMTAEHRIVSVAPYAMDDGGDDLWVACCACGFQTLGDPDYAVMKERFKEHSGGQV